MMFANSTIKVAWLPVAVLALVIGTGCITTRELLYSDPVFESTLQEFDSLHTQNKLPGLASGEAPRFIFAYEMHYDYFQRPSYATWRHASLGCTNVQVIMVHKTDRNAYAYFFCKDSGKPELMNTLHQTKRKAPWQIIP